MSIHLSLRGRPAGKTADQTSSGLDLLVRLRATPKCLQRHDLEINYRAQQMSNDVTRKFNGERALITSTSEVVATTLHHGGLNLTCHRSPSRSAMIAGVGWPIIGIGIVAASVGSSAAAAEKVGLTAISRNVVEAVATASKAIQVASVISESPEASAVLWFPAMTLTPVMLFRTLVEAGTTASEYVPLPIFTRMAAYQDVDEGTTPTFGVFGVGFYRFLGRDIEFVPKPRPIAEIVGSFNRVSSWLMQKGLIVADGDTCGASETEIIRVRYQDEGSVIKSPVLMLDIERFDPSLSPIYPLDINLIC